VHRHLNRVDIMKTSLMTGEYIREMLNKGEREDSRKMLEYRPITVTCGVIPNAEGSAEANIGNTKVLAGVKISVAEPMPDKPMEGNIMTAAELLPLASEEYDIGPPSPEAIELARVVDRGIRAANVINLEKLYISEGKVWSVFIDLYVLNYDGNLFDACTLAATAALLSARMPKYDAEKEEVIREGNLGRLETSNLLTSCTFGNVAGKILLDPSGNEELFMDARLTIANDEKNIRAMQKGLSGGFSKEEINQMMDAAFERSKQLREIVKKAAGV
jgi:exosome complex component RRP42